MTGGVSEIVRSFYGDVLAGGDLAGLDRLFAPDYTPHVPAHKTMPIMEQGLEPLQRKLRANGPVANEVYRTAVDENLVFVQVLFRAQPAISGVDIFRLDAAGLIAEHWNIRQPLAGEAPETVASRYAGPPKSAVGVSPEIIARNRDRAYSLYREVWSKANADLALDYYTPAYIQHNPHIASGAERIRAMIATDIRRYIDYHKTDFPIETLHIGAEADLVFVHFEIAMAGLGRNDGDPSTIVDIFRVDQDGKFAEHWDVCHMERDGLPDHMTLY